MKFSPVTCESREYEVKSVLVTCPHLSVQNRIQLALSHRLIYSIIYTIYDSLKWLMVDREQCRKMEKYFFTYF